MMCVAAFEGFEVGLSRDFEVGFSPMCAPSVVLLMGCQLQLQQRQGQPS